MTGVGALLLAFISSCALPATVGAFEHATPEMPSIRAIQQIAMVNSDFGYGLFELASGSTCASWLGRTTNKGLTFARLVHIQSWTCGSTFTEEITADGKGDVFVYGNGLFVSHDFGTRWSRTPMAGDIEEVAAVSNSVWLTDETCRSAAAISCPLRVEISDNGGHTWAPDHSQPEGLRALNSPTTILTTTIVRSSSQVAYVFAGPPTQHRAYKELPMWVTTDSGRSWRKRELRCGQGPFFGPVVSASRDGVLLSICAGQPYTGYQEKSTSVSRNGGRTWVVGAPCGMSSPFVDGYVGSVSALSSAVAFEAGEGAGLNMTRNDGAHWAAVRNIGDPGGGPEQVTFVNSQQGFVLGAAAPSGAVEIWHTHDGGLHWTGVIPHVR